MSSLSIYNLDANWREFQMEMPQSEKNFVAVRNDFCSAGPLFQGSLTGSSLTGSALTGSALLTLYMGTSARGT